MGKVNNALCEYFATAEYFADFWNGTEFQYLKSLNEKQLVRMDKEYYKAGKKQKSDLRRDSVWRYEGKRRMILGMELLDSIDYTMPVRIMDYNVQEMKQYYEEHKVHFHELDDTSIDAMGALLGREDLKKFKREEGGIDMCKAFDDVQEMGRAEGRAEIIERMMKKLKLTAEEALELLEIPMNERAELL